jgi:membrane fusion protein, multidrug efflux system
MKTSVKNCMLMWALFSSTTAFAGWDGTLDWARRTEMSTPASGVVARVLVRAGERVKENTVLLQLEQTTLKARVEQAKAVFQHATLMREEAERELNRSQELYDRTLLADHDLKLAQLAFAEADASYQRGRADLQAAEDELDDSELHAPFDAIVLDRRVQPAQTVVNQLSADPQMVLASAKEMLVRFTAQTDELSKLAPGNKVNVECDGERYQGIIDAIRLDESRGSGSSSAKGYAVEVLFATDKPLFPGVAASVSLP